jgi:hypothetical protein
MYRSPSCTYDDFILWLSTIHNSFFSTSSSVKIILLGDFNLSHFDWTVPCTTNIDQSHSALLNFMYEHSLSQLNLFPTREANTLDLLFTNIPDRIADVCTAPPFSTSDHDSILFSLGVFR